MNSQFPTTETEEKSILKEWIIAGLAIVYMTSPVDIIPNIPVVGWIDDFFIGSGGVLNLVEGYIEQHNTFMARIVKMLK